VHGGPGVPDYLAPVAGIVEDLCLVHHYDQRGTGRSLWVGVHTIARHVRDLASLLDAWGHDRVVLMGHSFGTDMASYFLLAHPGRVAGLIQLAGPFLDPWREADLAAQRVRRSGEQQARLDELDVIAVRTDAEEIDYLTLSWFTDHADRARAWDWALAAARTLRPVNYAMNTQLHAARKTGPLESRVDELREFLPRGSEETDHGETRCVRSTQPMVGHTSVEAHGAEAARNVPNTRDGSMCAVLPMNDSVVRLPACSLQFATWAIELAAWRCDLFKLR
jgi:pimeloyl-ACP methyl ester carboxylesterase